MLYKTYPFHNFFEMPQIQQIESKWFHELFSADAVCNSGADSAYFSGLQRLCPLWIKQTSLWQKRRWNRFVYSVHYGNNGKPVLVGALLWTLTHRAILIKMVSLSVHSHLMFCSTAADANKPSGDVKYTRAMCTECTGGRKALVFMVFSLLACMNNSRVWFLYPLKWLKVCGVGSVCCVGVYFTVDFCEQWWNSHFL